MADLWRKRLRPASFNGIPFKIESHEFTSGRNAVMHETPSLFSTYTEDTGQKTKVYSMSAYIIDDNYFALRDALIFMCNLPGPGLLVHPYYGSKMVHCTECVVTENNVDGRMARFSLTFMEAGEAAFPFSIVDKISKFFDVALVANAVVQNVFAEVLVLERMPGFVIESAADVVRSFTTTVGAAIKTVEAIPEIKSQLQIALKDLHDSLDELFLDNVELASAISGVVSLVQQAVPKPPEEATAEDLTIDVSSGRDDTLEIFYKILLFDSGYADIAETTPSRIQQKANDLAIESLIKQLCIIALAQNSVDKTYKSNENAKTQRERVSEYINAELSLTGSDEIYQALSDLNGVFVEALPNTDSPLASVKTYTPHTTLPSLLLMYELYESIENEIDLLKRNGVRNPNFVSGELEVLSSG